VGRDNAIGVDPEMGGTHRMTSDAFFEYNKVQVSLCELLASLMHLFSCHSVSNSLCALKLRLLL
jgi:hypothetical protein